MTLSAVFRSDMDANDLQAYYRAALKLGVTDVQIPAAALALLGGVALPARTVLEISPGWANIPNGIGGYIGVTGCLPGRVICETAIYGAAPELADEARIIADATLFGQDYAGIFSALAQDTRFSLCVRNAGDLGTALAVEWVLAGGRRIAASLTGIGGYAPLEEVLAALHVAGYPLVSIHLEQLRSVSEAFERLTRCAIPAHKAVIGSRLFDVESGVHVDGMMKNRQCYEPFAPEAVGAKRRIVIGKHSGKRALALKLKELGLPGDNLAPLLRRVREESIRLGGALEDDALAALAKRMQGDNAG